MGLSYNRLASAVVVSSPGCGSIGSTRVVSQLRLNPVGSMNDSGLFFATARRRSRREIYEVIEVDRSSPGRVHA